MDFLSKILKKFFSNYYLSYPILIWILFLLFAAFYPYSFNVENSRYLLSAISQGMAAIFAIIFTILLVFTQVSRYSSYKMLIDRGTLIYAILFIFNIFFPLILLHIDRLDLAKFGLSFASLPVLLIFWFLKHTEFLYSPDNIVKMVGSKYARFIDRGEDFTFQELHDIAIKAFNNNDIDIFFKTIFQFLKQAKYNYMKKYLDKFSDTYAIHSNQFGFNDAIYRIKQIGDYVINDSRSLDVLCKNLVDVSEFVSLSKVPGWYSFCDKILDILNYLKSRFNIRDVSLIGDNIPRIYICKTFIHLKSSSENYYNYRLDKMNVNSLNSLKDDLNFLDCLDEENQYMSGFFRKQHHDIIREIKLDIKAQVRNMSKP